MSEWKKVKFLDFIVLQRGFDLTKDSIKDGPYPVVCSTSIMGYHNNYKVEGPGVVTGRSGTLGETQYVKGNFWPHNTTLFVKDFKGNNRQFVYYFLKNFDIASMGGGAAIPSLNRNVLSNLSVTIPDLSIQNNIANILSRYDSLIENYQKQIKLLEEAAQRLYKEWFVDLHFPGHETTKIVDGVPEGWEKKKVGDMISKIQRTKQVSANNYQTSGQIPVIDQSRNFIAGYTDDAECLVKVTVPYIVFGDHTRILKYIPFSFAKGADGTQLIMSNDLDRMPQTLFYNSLIEIDLSNYSYARHFKYLKEESVLLPSEHVARKYDSIVSRYYQSIQGSREQIRLLTEARDRLLPKLMSGEIDLGRNGLKGQHAHSPGQHPG